MRIKKFLAIFISIITIFGTLFYDGISVSAVTNTIFVHETNVDFSHVYEKSSGITLSTFFHDRDPSGAGSVFPNCFVVAPGQQHITYKADGPISWFFLQAAVNRTIVTDYSTNINKYINVSFSNDNITYKSLKAGTSGPGNDYLFLFPATPKYNVSATNLTSYSAGFNGTLLGANYGDMRFDNHPWTTGFNTFDPNIRYIRLDINYTPTAPNASTPVFYLLESGFQYIATTPTASVVNAGAVPARNYFDIKFSEHMTDASITPDSLTIAGNSITATSVERIDSANNIWRVHLSDHLIPKVTYTVNLANTILSEANLALSNSSAQFTTVVSDRASIDSISFTGPSGLLTTTLENGNITCSASVYSLYVSGAASQKITLVTAYYDGEKLIGVGADSKIVNEGSSGSFSTSVPINSTTPSNVHAEVLIWDDMIDIMPLCSSTSFPH